MGWEREGFESHVGTVGVLLADGSEPRPVIFDMGSSSSFYESTSWWHYNGTGIRPTATSMRGRCACGWRAERTYPIDWEQVRRDDDPDVYDTSGLYEDWAAQMEKVAARQVALPEDMAGALRQLRERLDELVDGEPLVVLRAVGELEEVITSSARYAARLISLEDTPVPEVAEALGVTEKVARSRLSRYEFLR
ncbi:hypothetical protein ACGFYP_29490 [Streptomyces sp. NPDC048370]|uniref:hypothetical protein n=1 Tax=Streptomyces sp. NPDC048370 TaxID=3365540 RepID=UPI00371E0243